MPPVRKLPSADPKPAGTQRSTAHEPNAIVLRQVTDNKATGRTHTVGLPGGVTLEMVEIPKGSFCMGSESGSADEKPVHKVTISQPFFIGRFEVTQAQWQAVMGSNPSYFKDCGGDCPVENVTWNEVDQFIRKLSERSDPLLNAGMTYRLPTEAEWEYAGRAGTTGEFSGGIDAIAGTTLIGQ